MPIEQSLREDEHCGVSGESERAHQEKLCVELKGTM